MPNAPLQRKQGEAAPPLTATAVAPSFFLRTKLLAPRPAPALLTRPRLIERLRRNLARPVTLVTANAGSGKTTLVADFVRNLEPQKFVWYQLDHTDADPLVFLGYVAHGVRQLVPNFGGATLAYLQEAAGDLARRPERAVDVLLNEVLEHVEQQLVLVLDDYHHLGAETAVHKVVDRLLNYLPDVMHVVIISREVPPLALVRMRSQSSLAVVNREELLFTDEETRELFRNVFDLELTAEQLAEYRERTQGWITALQLVRQVAQRELPEREAGEEAASATTAADLADLLRRSERDIFDYFAEEVFADEPEDVRRFLLGVSLLERLDPRACRALFADEDAVARLRHLARRNVFVSVASDGRGEEFRLHPLFRDFLRRRFREEAGDAVLVAEHRRCARHFLADGQHERAIQHLFAAGDFGEAAAVIAARGGDWIGAGAFSSLASLIAALPPDALAAHPRALAHQAELARLHDDLASASALFRRAATLLHERGDAEGEADALHSLASIERRRGDADSALDTVARAESLTDERSPVRMRCANTRGLCLTAQGRWKEAEREFRVALRMAEEGGDERFARIVAHNLGTPAGLRGDFSEAMRWLGRLLGREGAAPAPQQAIAHLNIARCHYYRGEFDDCERHLERALEVCQTFNLTSLRAEVFEFYGNLWRERDDPARAADFYDRAARDYDEAGVDVSRRELTEERALLSLRLGEWAAARAAIDRLIAERREVGGELGVQTATLTRGRILLARGETALAREDLEPSRRFFRENNFYYYEAQACVALAACERAAGQPGRAAEHLRRAFDLAARYDYDYWLKREVSADPALFVSTGAAELLPPDIREELTAAAAAAADTRPAAATSAAGGESPDARSASPSSTAAGPSPAFVSARAVDLTVNLLGAVEIFRDPARPFAADAWRTKRSRDLFCFVASRPHRRTSKDLIIDAFWPDADLRTAEKNFYPTMSHVRKALNSNQPLKQNFLVYRDSEYMLNPECSYRIDVEEFDRLVAEGDAARRRTEHEEAAAAFERAVALYRGEFMQGCYDEWAEQQRGYYREQYVRLLETLARLAQKGGDWSLSLRLAQDILRDDPFREDAHRMVMRAHAALGNRVAVREQYEELRRLLLEELGVQPTSETQAVYRGIMG